MKDLKAISEIAEKIDTLIGRQQWGNNYPVYESETGPVNVALGLKELLINFAETIMISI